MADSNAKTDTGRQSVCAMLKLAEFPITFTSFHYNLHRQPICISMWNGGLNLIL